MKHADIVNKMSLEQKAAFVSGFDYWHLEEAPELGLPKIMVTDGPHGLRKQNPNGDSVGLPFQVRKHLIKNWIGCKSKPD